MTAHEESVSSKPKASVQSLGVQTGCNHHWMVCADLSMKGEGSLFCFVVMRSTEPGCFRSCSWCLWKALDEEGRMGLVR
jgi:hypothetical protein